MPIKQPYINKGILKQNQLVYLYKIFIIWKVIAIKHEYFNCFTTVMILNNSGQQFCLLTAWVWLDFCWVITSCDRFWSEKVNKTIKDWIIRPLDNSCFVWPEDWTVALIGWGQQCSFWVKQNSCCPWTTSITAYCSLHLIIILIFKKHFLSKCLNLNPSHR